MKTVIRSLTCSAREIKKLRVLTACAILAALAVALNYVASINVGPYIKIGFSGIPNQLVDWLFGPVTGMIFAAALDVIKFALKPDGVFFFGYTLSAMIAALIYGLSYYKRPLNFWRVLITKAIVAVIVNVGLNTLWLSMQGGKAFFALLPLRALKNAIMTPIEAAIFYLIALALDPVVSPPEAVAQMDESVILHNMLINSPLMLNGKTLSTGSEEEYVAPGGMKMKRHYTVNGRTIVETF